MSSMLGRMQVVLSRRNVVFAVFAAALLLAAVLVAVITSGSDDDGAVEVETGAPLPGADETNALLADIPQDGIELGSPDAPVTLVEFADLQCPFCAQYSVDVFPTLVEEYVRPGQVKMIFRGLAFIGEDSEKALRAAFAAGEQNRLWHVADLLYRNQGAENSGWVSDEVLRALGPSIPGLDVDAMLAAVDSSTADAEIAAAAEAAESAQVRGTPAFLLGRSDAQLQPLEVSRLEPDEFRTAIDALLES
jgi:protein-disulfide isomerase